MVGFLKKQFLKKQKITKTSDIKPFIDINIYADSEAEKQKIIRVINKLGHSKHGKNIIKKAKENNIDIVASKNIDSKGTYNISNNKLTINSNNSENRMLLTAAHELRHAEQGKEKNAFFSTLGYNVKSYTMGVRAMEADAVAFSLLCAWEVSKKTSDKQLWGELKQSYKTVSCEIEDKLKTNSDELNQKNAMKNAFMGWYKDEAIKRIYENDYIDICDNTRTNQKHLYNDERMHAQNLTSQDIVGSICSIDGNHYIDPKSNILEKNQCLNVTKVFKSFFQDFSKQRQKDTGYLDNSIKEMPIKQNNKSKNQAITLKNIQSARS